PIAVTTGDYDGDGHLDLAAVNYDLATVSVLLWADDTTFAGAVDYICGDIPTDIVSADLNGDHVLDLVTVDQGSDPVWVLIGAGGSLRGGKRRPADAGRLGFQRPRRRRPAVPVGLRRRRQRHGAAAPAHVRGGRAVPCDADRLGRHPFRVGHGRGQRERARGRAGVRERRRPHFAPRIREALDVHPDRARGRLLRDCERLAHDGGPVLGRHGLGGSHRGHSRIGPD